MNKKKNKNKNVLIEWNKTKIKILRKSQKISMDKYREAFPFLRYIRKLDPGTTEIKPRLKFSPQIHKWKSR